MKAPNGAGTVYKVSGARRKPWRAMASVINNDGDRARVTVGYFATKKDGLIALAQFCDAPYDIETGKKTFAEIFEMWKADNFTKDSNRNTVKNYVVAFGHCSALHNKPMCEIKLKDCQAVCDGLSTYSTSSRCASLMSQMFDFCVRHEILRKNYAADVRVKQKRDPKEKNPYNADELNAVFKCFNNPNDIISHTAKMIVMLCYSGLRIDEFLSLQKGDAHLEDDTPYIYVRKSKTDNGIRNVPIHSRVLPLWKEFYDNSIGETVIGNINGQSMTYDNFKRRYLSVLNEHLGQSHTAHETRHTFISMAKVSRCDDTYIKKIVGHTSRMSLTEKTYTHLTIKDLSEEIEKIK